MSHSIRCLFATLLLLPVGIDAVASTKDYTWLLLLKVNKPPVVDTAGLDQDIAWAEYSVYLDATVTDDSKDPLTYEWTKLDGPVNGGVSFIPDNTEDTTAIFTASGTYILQIRASNSKLTSTSTVTIVLSNIAPRVNAGEKMQLVYPTKSVSLNATVSDHPKDDLTYAWTKVSGPGTANFSHPLAEDTNVSMSKTGTYVFKLRASDGELASTDTVTVEYIPEPVVKIDVITAVGDSITVGDGDNDCKLGNSKACSGYTPVLKNLLPDVQTIFEEGTSGQTSAGGRNNIQRIINLHPNSDQYLVQYGTNDASRALAVPSGQGLNPGDSSYSGTFKDNMQRVINAIKSADALPVLAKAPYAKATPGQDTNQSQTYRNPLIRQYNRAIDELVAINSIGVTPPDFYGWFENHQDQLRSWHLLDPGRADNLHPNHDGYNAMARIWRNCLLGVNQCTAF